ncbi:right-handed parallel beta-helix repeat-containing protein [Pseudomonas sp. ISL-84]|nr:right-handed parallel beta-helix repeat-containing protein [Pseudomonas sp. ISL-84]
MFITFNFESTKSIFADTEKTYTLEFNRWGIYNNGTHPKETTEGINKALKWASENGYNTFIVPNGTYLISKDLQINMVSNITFELKMGAVLQKESNNLSNYTLLHLGPGIHNVTLKGGTYKGDKDTHDYSSGGTHEGGYGIVTAGATDITIDGIKSINFTGDGLAVGAMGKLIDEFYTEDFKSGSVNDSGQLINDNNKIRLENLPLTDPFFDIQKTFQFIHQQNMPKKAQQYAAYFFKKDGTFITKHDSSTTNTPVGWGVTSIPKDASYMHVVFDTGNVDDNIYLELWVQGVSKNITVKNSEFAYNRRQGITVGGAQDVLIKNNRIHDMKGTAPQSGIDVEAGYNLNNRITIKDNHFYNNQAYDLILYDGRNAIVDGNLFASKSIGLAISEPFKYAEITNNHFDGSRIFAYNYATFKDNKMNDAMAAFLGHDLVIEEMEFSDSLVNLASSKPFGIKASNITVNNTKKQHTQFGINNNPIHLKNVTITGQAALDSFAGNAPDGSIFDNLKVIGYARSQLPRGTYNNTVFEAAEGQGGVAVNNSGVYEFNNSTFTSHRGGFEINQVHGMPDSVTLKNSTIHVLGDNNSGISIKAGKQVIIENNTIKTGLIPNQHLAVIKVGDYWKKDEKYTVSNLIIKGNKLTSKDKEAVGISTIHAGVNAPSYEIEDNAGNLKL